MNKIKKFIKKEPVLSIAALAALISCFFVKPDALYLEYIDLRTIVLLYCLMAAVAGFGRAGTFAYLAHKLCTRSKSSRALAFVLVGLCFFGGGVQKQNEVKSPWRRTGAKRQQRPERKTREAH